QSDYQNELADSHRALGMLYRTTGRSTQANAFYREALALRQQTVSNFPARGDYRNALARDFSELSRLYGATSRPADAEASLRQALTTLEDLTRDYPDGS